MLLHVSSTRAYRQEAKIVLYNLWYHHTYRCDDTRGCTVHWSTSTRRSLAGLSNL